MNQYENLTILELYNKTNNLLNELKRTEAEFKSLKEFKPYIIKENYDKLSIEDKFKFCLICHHSDESDELKEINIHLYQISNLLTKSNLEETEEKLNQLRQEVKTLNEFIKQKYNF